MIYLVPLLFAITCSIFYKPNHHIRKYKRLYNILLLINILIFGLRYRVGGDTLNYMLMFDASTTLSNFSFINPLDPTAAPLFTLLMSICKTLCSNFVLFQIVHSTILNVTIFAFLKRYSINPFWSFILFYLILGLYFNTEIMKETLAICMFLLGYKYLLNKNLKRYYIYAVLGIGFHYGAVILLVIPFLQKVRFNRFFFLICILFLLSINAIFSYVLGNINNQDIHERVELYENQLGSGLLNMNYVFMAVIRFVLIPAFVLFLVKKEKSLILNMEPMVCLFILMGLGCISYQTIFQRFCNYFYLFYICLFADFISKNLKSKTILSLSLITVMLTLIIYNSINPINLVRYFPYHSIVHPQEEELREYMWENGND